MSTDAPCRSLAEYVSALMLRLGASDPVALTRLRRVVGARRARIAVDQEAVDVQWKGEQLQLTSDGGAVDGTGQTDRQTVLALLAGELEVHDAIVDGRLEVTGKVDDIERMFLAIEILIDAAARSPDLQALAGDYRADPCLPPRQPRIRRPPTPNGEHDLLGRLGLLP